MRSLPERCASGECLVRASPLLRRERVSRCTEKANDRLSGEVVDFDPNAKREYDFDM